MKSSCLHFDIGMAIQMLWRWRSCLFLTQERCLSSKPNCWDLSHFWEGHRKAGLWAEVNCVFWLPLGTWDPSAVPASTQELHAVFPISAATLAIVKWSQHSVKEPMSTWYCGYLSVLRWNLLLIRPKDKLFPQSYLGWLFMETGDLSPVFIRSFTMVCVGMALRWLVWRCHLKGASHLCQREVVTGRPQQILLHYPAEEMPLGILTEGKGHYASELLSSPT